jgi:hypothetical protein
MFSLTKWSNKYIFSMFCSKNLIITTKFEKFKINNLVQNYLNTCNFQKYFKNRQSQRRQLWFFVSCLHPSHIIKCFTNIKKNSKTMCHVGWANQRNLTLKVKPKMKYYFLKLDAMWHNSRLNLGVMWLKFQLSLGGLD